MAVHPASLAEIAQRCKLGGLRALSRSEKQEFRTLLRKELRKCAFEPRSSIASQVLGEFCDHVIRGFDASANPVSVLDSQPYLRRNAKRLSKQTIPLASLILYAAWIEHWTNMMVTVAMLRRGDSPSKPVQYLKSQPRFKDKLDTLANALKIAALPKKLRDAIIQVVDLRNVHLHVLWEGRSPPHLRRDLTTMRAVVNRCESILGDATQFEYQHFDTSYADLVSSVMRVR